MFNKYLIGQSLDLYQKIIKKAHYIAREKYHMRFQNLPEAQKKEIKDEAYKITLEEIIN